VAMNLTLILMGGLTLQPTVMVGDGAVMALPATRKTFREGSARPESLGNVVTMEMQKLDTLWIQF